MYNAISLCFFAHQSEKQCRSIGEELEGERTQRQRLQDKVRSEAKHARDHKHQSVLRVFVYAIDNLRWCRRYVKLANMIFLVT